MIESIEWNECELCVTIPENDPGSTRIAYFATAAKLVVDIDWEDHGEWSICNIDVIAIGANRGVVQSLGPKGEGELERRLWAGTLQSLLADKRFCAHVEDSMPEEIATLLKAETEQDHAYEMWRRAG